MAQPAMPEGRPVALSKTAAMMAKHMGRAWQAPMFAVSMAVDMTAAAGPRPEGVTVSDVIVAACARALGAHPRLNAHWGEDGVTEFDARNVGLAVAAPGGLTVPVIYGAEALGLPEIAERRRALVAKAREGRLSIADLTGGTFTVSNLGMFGVSGFTAILNVPQVAILAVGGTERRQVWNDGAPDWRPICEMAVTCDHRAVDGAEAAGFLRTLRREIETGSGAGA